MKEYQIVDEHPDGYLPRGGCRGLWDYGGPECVVSGPAETGKTRACLEKLNCLLWEHAGAQAAMVRKQYKTLFPTAYQTLVKKVLEPGSDVRPWGGERPEWLDYPNGSRLWLAGMDSPGKALSSERDFIYVNQAEELTLTDWETLTTRATGRAGNAPFAQTFGDCNPGPPHHWIRHRESLRVFESRHKDNPVLWDGAAWTEQGQRTLSVLNALTGVRKARLLEGRWVSAEGTVYAFDAERHLLDPFPVPAGWTRFRSVDFGYSNPFVCQWWALDPDGRMILYREIYMTRRTVRQHAAQIRALSAGESFEATVADTDAEDRATLAEEGIHTLPADKALGPGIQAVEARLAPAGDGRPRLLLVRGALVERDESLAEKRHPVCTEQEFDAYAWPKAADGRPVKEAPVDMFNHGMDALRYAVRYADQRQRVGGATIGTGRSRLASAPAGTFHAGGKLGAW